MEIYLMKSICYLQISTVKNVIYLENSDTNVMGTIHFFFCIFYDLYHIIFSLLQTLGSYFFTSFHESRLVCWCSFVFSGRVCPFTGKKANKANKVSFSNHKTKKLQFVNLQYKKVWWEAGNRYVKLRLSTKALKTIEKNGLDAVAKKAGIDLRKEWKADTPDFFAFIC